MPSLAFDLATPLTTPPARPRPASLGRRHLGPGALGLPSLAPAQATPGHALSHTPDRLSSGCQLQASRPPGSAHGACAVLACPGPAFGTAAL